MDSNVDIPTCISAIKDFGKICELPSMIRRMGDQCYDMKFRGIKTEYDKGKKYLTNYISQLQQKMNEYKKTYSNEIIEGLKNEFTELEKLCETYSTY